MKTIPAEILGANVATKANIYFEGKVVSHTLVLPGGAKKTLGLIYPGEFHFSTGAAERMEIIAGNCHMILDGKTESQIFADGSYFEVPAKSGFTITVQSGLCEYLCSFLP